MGTYNFETCGLKSPIVSNIPKYILLCNANFFQASSFNIFENIHP